jgi:mono/diheme cytochrome c family protein/plastocyanin
MNTSKQINVMILLVFLAVFATGAYTLWDQDRASEAEDKQLEHTITRGAFLFTQNCRACHGDAGEGGAAANRLRAAPALNRQDLQGTLENTEGEEIRDPIEYANDFKFIYYTITCGRVGKVMPAWGQSQGGTLNEEQIKQLTVFILNGASSLHEEADEDGAEASEEAGPATPWEEAREFAQRGVPAFHENGDDHNELELAQAIDESQTEIVLNHVVFEKAPAVLANERLAILGEDGLTAELLLVTAVDAETNTITVERGVGSTDASAFPAGTEVLNQPVVPEGQIVELSCGQRAGSQVVLPPEPPSATLSITAQGSAWNKTALSAIAGGELTITVQNNDDGTGHDWVLYGGEDADAPRLAGTEIENGVVTQSLDFGPLEPGEYYYNCEVHPGQMEGVLTSYAPGTGPGTPAADATETP